MPSAFVWFHHDGQNANETAQFLTTLLALPSAAGPGGTTLLSTDAGPFAALASAADRLGERDGWIPFVEVADVSLATERALALGARLVREKGRGPAGEFSIICAPGGATLALWSKV